MQREKSALSGIFEIRKKEKGEKKMAIMTTENDGSEIISTNYFETEKGFVYLSINAGAFRLLVPDAFVADIKDMATATEVIITRGPWHEKGVMDAIEILFEDHTDDPYSIHLLSAQVDRMPTTWDRDRPGQPPRWKFHAYTKEGKVLELPCRYRLAKSLPCLKKWAA